MGSIYGYIRTSRQLQEGVPGMNPASQELQLRGAGVTRDNIYRDVGVSGTTGTNQRRGWHALDGRLAGGDTWLSSPSTASVGPGRTPSGPSARFGTGG